MAVDAVCVERLSVPYSLFIREIKGILSKVPVK